MPRTIIDMPRTNIPISRTVAGTRTIVNSVLGNGFSFRSSPLSDHITITTIAAQNSLTQFTFSAWVYRLSAGGSMFGRVFQKGGPSNGYWVIYTGDNGHTENLCFLATWTGVGAWDTPQGSLTNNAWHHIVVQYDTSSTANNPVIYIDNVLQVLVRFVAPSGSKTADSAVGYLGNDAPFTDSWHGYIDEVRFYNRLITVAEIGVLFAKGDVQSGLVGWWPLDGIVGPTTPDYSTSNTGGAVSGPSLITGIVPLNRRLV